MRLVVARCEVVYTGRVTAVLPEAVRLLILKPDGSVLVHDDSGGFKPLNCIRRVFRPEVSAEASRPDRSRVQSSQEARLDRRAC
jgi:RecB family endonuclease NucS